MAAAFRYKLVVATFRRMVVDSLVSFRVQRAANGSGFRCFCSKSSRPDVLSFDFVYVPAPGDTATVFYVVAFHE